MSVLSFAQWVQSTAFFTALRGSAYVYPIVLSTHMIAIALFGGMILLLDVRLLGLRRLDLDRPRSEVEVETDGTGSRERLLAHQT